MITWRRDDPLRRPAVARRGLPAAGAVVRRVRLGHAPLHLLDQEGRPLRASGGLRRQPAGRGAVARGRGRPPGESVPTARGPPSGGPLRLPQTPAAGQRPAARAQGPRAGLRGFPRPQRPAVPGARPSGGQEPLRDVRRKVEDSEGQTDAHFHVGQAEAHVRPHERNRSQDGRRRGGKSCVRGGGGREGRHVPLHAARDRVVRAGAAGGGGAAPAHPRAARQQLRRRQGSQVRRGFLRPGGHEGPAAAPRGRRPRRLPQGHGARPRGRQEGDARRRARRLHRPAHRHLRRRRPAGRRRPGGPVRHLPDRGLRHFRQHDGLRAVRAGAQPGDPAAPPGRAPGRAAAHQLRVRGGTRVPRPGRVRDSPQVPALAAAEPRRDGRLRPGRRRRHPRGHQRRRLRQRPAQGPGLASRPGALPAREVLPGRQTLHVPALRRRTQGLHRFPCGSDTDEARAGAPAATLLGGAVCQNAAALETRQEFAGDDGRRRVAPDIPASVVISVAEIPSRIKTDSGRLHDGGRKGHRTKAFLDECFVQKVRTFKFIWLHLY